MREKLIELLESTVPKEEVAAYGEVYVSTSRVADHLIANCVTIPVRCKDCDHGSHVDTPEGRVWCEKMCRYMVYEGYCSYGQQKNK